MFANCSMPGQHFGFPDVCLTPTPVGPVPIPYPNFGMHVTAIPLTASMKHLLMFMPSHNMATTIPTSLGDNVGVAGGVAAGVFMGPARNTKGSMKVIVGGTPATRMLDTTMQNSTNVPVGLTLVPDQFKVLILT